MLNNPLVSVIIPTYNYAHFICAAIDSVLNSDFPQNEVEIIVIDDGSTDDTSKKIKVYQDQVKYIAQENSGKAWATKIGIEQARGKYLFNLDADDLFLPNKIKKVVEIFEEDKDIVHVAHPAIHWNIYDDTKSCEQIPKDVIGRKISGKELLSYFYKRRILFGGGSTFAARAEILKCSAITKEIDMFIDEYLVLITLNQGQSFFLKQPLSIWRIHGQNFSNESSTITICVEKMQRSMRSVEAVLNNLLNSNFEEKIKKVYGLNTKVAKLALKEELGEKSFYDILDMWLYFLSNFTTFSQDVFSITKNYNLVNRSMPTSIIRALKQAKKTLSK